MDAAVRITWILALLSATPLAAQQPPAPPPDGKIAALPQEPPATPFVEADQLNPPWQTAWGLAGLRIFADGPKIAPNGVLYHPSFTLDLNANFWIWQRQGMYLFTDIRFWGQRPENDVTNGRDGGLGFSKRQLDLSGGVAWNYAGAWEARVSGYSNNNLNRGMSFVTPAGINDGALLENRYYLSEEYEKLGQTGFDVARASFLSVGWFPTKEMVGNDGELFKPGILLRAYLTCDLGDWPCYAFADASFITERSMEPRLLLLDTGVAARPFATAPQWEFRLGVENTADFQVESVKNLWYVTARFIF